MEREAASAALHYSVSELIHSRIVLGLHRFFFFFKNIVICRKEIKCLQRTCYFSIFCKWYKITQVRMHDGQEWKWLINLVQEIMVVMDEIITEFALNFFFFLLFSLQSPCAWPAHKDHRPSWSHCRCVQEEVNSPASCSFNKTPQFTKCSCPGVFSFNISICIRHWGDLSNVLQSFYFHDVFLINCSFLNFSVICLGNTCLMPVQYTDIKIKIKR